MRFVPGGTGHAPKQQPKIKHPKDTLQSRARSKTTTQPPEQQTKGPDTPESKSLRPRGPAQTQKRPANREDTSSGQGDPTNHIPPRTTHTHHHAGTKKQTYKATKKTDQSTRRPPSWNPRDQAMRKSQELKTIFLTTRWCASNGILWVNFDYRSASLVVGLVWGLVSRRFIQLLYYKDQNKGVRPAVQLTTNDVALTLQKAVAPMGNA